MKAELELEDNSPIKHLCDAIEAAHARVQSDFEQINPVVAVNRKMRDFGIATDLMTIDCLRTGKRILIVLHDSEPHTADYQFCLRDEDPADDFTRVPLTTITSQTLYNWMCDTFSS